MGFLLLLPSHYMSFHLAFTFGAGLRWAVGVNGRCWVLKLFLKHNLLLIIIIILTNLSLLEDNVLSRRNRWAEDTVTVTHLSTPLGIVGLSLFPPLFLILISFFNFHITPSLLSN